MTFPRKSRQPDADPNTLLLSQLLEAQPVPQRAHPAPATLRSVDAQRAHALQGFLRRTWVDRALIVAERLLVVAALLIFGWWFVDGPVRDWLHDATRSAASVRRDAVVLPTAAIAPSVPHAARLPFVTPAMIATEGDDRSGVVAPAPSADDFLAPRRAVPQEPIRVAAEPTRLIMPTVALDTPVVTTYVVDGVWQVAEYAAGYMSGTAKPGTGNTALAGHAGLRGAVFRDLGRLQAGDPIFVDAGGWRYQYHVRDRRDVWPTQVEVLAPTETPILTLITCTNWDTQRLVVTADLVDSMPAPQS